MLPRDRRLDGEYRDMQRLVEASSLISFTCQGVPPTSYRVTLRCGGLAHVGGQIGPISFHQFDLDLDEMFPLVPPTIVWRTPIFHPNIKASHACTGDIWFPGHSLAELCVGLCELVQYKQFNIYDPLDRDAALWLVAQLAIDDAAIPVDPTPVFDADFEVVVESKLDSSAERA
ncbi:ubiquitin-conjugating enzyme E2 [Dactylosporangium sp. CA-233914]|uniref:ubiquitin-conjugating enzyme E2 n=1 Tax=Dactylosporangium sp. CA-233914 TaxID=3239934 RepID=UPI003D9064DF